MTTKAKGGAKGKGKPGRPLEIYRADGVQRNPFNSNEEAQAAIEAFCSHLFTQPEAASLFLLLMYAMANEHTEAGRTCMYYDACKFLTGEIEGIEEVFEADHVRTHARLRKGGEQ